MTSRPIGPNDVALSREILAAARNEFGKTGQRTKPVLGAGEDELRFSSPICPAAAPRIRPSVVNSETIAYQEGGDCPAILSIRPRTERARHARPLHSLGFLQWAVLTCGHEGVLLWRRV